MKIFKTAGLLFLLANASFLYAADMYGVPDDDAAAIQSAFTSLFNEDFQNADLLLEPLKPRAQKYPLIQTAIVVRHWWEMASQVLENDAEASKPFTAAADECLAIVERTKKHKTQGLLSLATTLGLMSRWSAANRAWLAAYFRGTKAGEYARRTIEEDKDAVDAYMTLGAFVYGKEKIRQSLSPDEKPSNPEDMTPAILGLSHLHKAYDEGTYFKMPAGLLLAGILTNEKPSEAVPLLQELREALPRSGFVHMLLLTALYNAGNGDELEKEIAEFEGHLNEQMYPPRYEAQLHFAKGLAHFRKKEWRAAEQEFKTAYQSKDVKNPYVIWAHLYRGYALDAAKKRETARAEYRRVLALPRRFASHDRARERLEKPFKPTDPEMKKLEV